MNVTEIWPGLRIRKTDFECNERASVIGTKRGIGRLARLAVEAAGQINGQPLGASGVHHPYRSVERLTRCARCAGSQKRIHDPFRALELAFQPTSAELARQINDRQAASLDDREICCRVAEQFVGWSKKQDLHLHAVQIEMSRNDKSVAGVIAFAANNCHRSTALELTKDINAAAARIFHQHEPRHSKFIDRAAIDFADFHSS